VVRVLGRAASQEAAAAGLGDLAPVAAAGRVRLVEAFGMPEPVRAEGQDLAVQAAREQADQERAVVRAGERVLEERVAVEAARAELALGDPARARAAAGAAQAAVREQAEAAERAPGAVPVPGRDSVAGLDQGG
jgi:hypothetical protein